VDETGHSGDTGTAEGGSGGDSHDRTQLNGWATSDSPWSHAGAALEPEDEVRAWRRPAPEIRPFTRQPRPASPPPAGMPGSTSGEVRPFGDRSTSGEIPPFGDRSTSGEVRPFADRNTSGFAEQNAAFTSGDVPTPRPDPAPAGPGPGPGPAPSWSSGRARYSDLLAHLSPNGDEPVRSPSLQPGPVPSSPDVLGPDPLRPGTLRPEAPRNNSFASRPDSLPSNPYAARAESPPNNPFASRPDSLQADDARRTSEMRAIDAPPPASAPPYPYEGDLDDVARRPPAVQQRAAVPLSRPFPAVRPATPGGRRVDWNTTESARHALEPNTPAEGVPRVEPSTPAAETRPSAEPGPARTSYDPSSFPRRLPSYDPAPAGSAPSSDPSPGYAPPTAYAGPPGRSAGDPGSGPAQPMSRALPQRVPAEPDVPTVPEPPSVEPSAETPALARIATHLRRGDVLSARDREDGFDVNAILEAVREVDGVRDASLRATPTGAHSLRLDLADGADPAEVSRQVARLLQDRMGLDAAMQGASPPAAPAAPDRAPETAGSPAVAPPPAPPERARRVPTGRAPVSGGPAGGGRLPQSPQAGRASGGTVIDRPEVNGPEQPPSATGSTLEAVPTGSVDCGPPRPLQVGERPGPRVMIENVQVNTFGTEATVEVRLAVEGRTASGVATGPAVDGYLLRLCATATTHAVDELLAASDHADGPARCFVEHAAAVPFGPLQVAVVVLLLSCGGWVEQLAGSAVVTGDDRHAMVRATLAAVNRRLEALLS
jgi:hypothetical protein